MDLRQLNACVPIQVDLKAIDERPGPYCMSYGFELEPLIHSINNFGILNSPIVLKSRGGGLDVLLGYRRILALKSLGCEKVFCRDLTEYGFSQKELLLLNLSDNLTTRKFNDIEKGMILRRLLSHFPEKTVISDYLPPLELPANASVLDVFLKIVTLDDSLKPFIAGGSLSFHSLKNIMNLDNESQSNLLSCLMKIKFNFNQQKQFIELIEDISMIEKKKISTLLSESYFLGVIEKGKIPQPQKAKQVLATLRKRRFPLLTRAEENFQRSLSEMRLPLGVKIQPPPFFEGDDFKLEVSFKNNKELHEKLDHFSGLKGTEFLTDLWKKAD